MQQDQTPNPTLLPASGASVNGTESSPTKGDWFFPWRALSGILLRMTHRHVALLTSLTTIHLLLFPSAGFSQEKSLSQARQEFAAADKALNTTYQKAKTELSEYRFEQIQQEQRDWIEYRDRRSEAAARFDGGAEEGTEEANPEYWNAMAYLTETRVEILEAWLKTDSFAKTWEGVWIDGYGGILRISEEDAGSLTFTCSVVRGPTYHLGEIGGVAQANRSTARFATKIDDEEPETWLTFLKEGDGRIQIIGENTQYFHGARAYFDGKYLRTRELTAEDREAMTAER